MAKCEFDSNTKGSVPYGIRNSSTVVEQKCLKLTFVAWMPHIFIFFSSYYSNYG